MLLFLGFLSTCSNNVEVTEHNYQFTGEGEYWSAALTYTAEEVWGTDDAGVSSHSSENDYRLTITYKGDLEELASMDQLYYAYDMGTAGEGSTSLSFDQPVSNKEFTARGSGTGSIFREDMTVRVEVKWDGQEESLELEQ